LILHAHQTLGRFLLLAIPTIVIVAGAADIAEAKPTKKEEASQRFQKGVELYGDGDLRAALIEFRRAYELVPTYQLLYNMGQTAAELKDYVEAYDHYKRYLRKGRGKIDDDRRSEVREEIQLLEGYLASMRIRVSEDDAEVSIDGVVVGDSPLDGAVKVSAGRRRVVVTKEGFSRWERKIDLAGRDAETVKVQLISVERRDRQEDMPNPFLGEQQDRREPGFSNAFWASATVTGLLAVGSGFAAIQTLRQRNIYNEQLTLVPNSAANIKIAGDDLRQLALITDIALGLTAVGVVSTVVLASRNDSSSTRSSSLQMQVGPTNVALIGQF
jgi:tetratricopeptide (TPR) repeat protein